MKYFEMGPVWILEENYSKKKKKKKIGISSDIIGLPDISHFSNLSRFIAILRGVMGHNLYGL